MTLSYLIEDLVSDHEYRCGSCDKEFTGFDIFDENVSRQWGCLSMTDSAECPECYGEIEEDMTDL